MGIDAANYAQIKQNLALQLQQQNKALSAEGANALAEKQIAELLSATTMTNPIATDSYLSQTPAKETNLQTGKEADDGKISFGKKLLNLGKGILNSVKNIGKAIIENPLKTALIVGACFIPGVGPIIATGLAAYGAVKGTVGIVKGAIAADNAQTDQQAEEAFQNIGSGAFELGTSLIGIRGTAGAAKAALTKGATAAKAAKGVKALANVDDAATSASRLANITNKVKTATIKAKAFGKGVTGLDDVGTVAGRVYDSTGSVTKALAKGTQANAKAAANAVKEKVGNYKTKIKNRIGKNAGPDATPETAPKAETQKVSETIDTNKISKEIDNLQKINKDLSNPEYTEFGDEALLKRNIQKIKENNATIKELEAELNKNVPKSDGTIDSDLASEISGNKTTANTWKKLTDKLKKLSPKKLEEAYNNLQKEYGADSTILKKIDECYTNVKKFNEIKITDAELAAINGKTQFKYAAKGTVASYGYTEVPYSPTPINNFSEPTYVSQYQNMVLPELSFNDSTGMWA